MSEMEELIKKYLNEKGKLDCTDGFKIAAKLKCSTLEVGACAKAMDIRIDSCELGQFGKLEGGIYDVEAENRLTPLLDEKNRVTCKAARAAAAGIGLKKIRGTLKEKNYDVTFCELGCFKEKTRPRLYVKTKTWIENAEGELLFGKGKTEILELIEQEGSISKASEKIGMNYKKAWTHIKILQKNINDTMVQTKQGGGEDAGTTLTPVAREFMDNYRKLQAEIEAYANERFKELFLKPRNKKEFEER
ncbi:winged helix-turn-helix domain-containing protein [Sulfurospirillum diekertiae]|uniref:Winged helix-turn-helix domain-containing protein n=1 Tax=Sulfurospirillum diekertiae TaxID=1854492 RepID=A0A6G9VQC4_9BACT|nr:winged helix-turn-helix domain-containing protein [Sulfurospirillum diekertiae]QIR75718.1 winged helix-turn-helix domain-containing protein [Sulfurospirillum diekertiae]QIR78365.1 winged helix-turn-helix domain-containing protein [Sulfurospirillum diekertiae]